jgi:RNA polymerase sigma-70 factor (family 1)
LKFFTKNLVNLFYYFSHVSDNSDFSDIALQVQASQGEEQAFRILFDRYHPRLFQYLFNLVKSKEVAEELVMDVFLKLWLSKDMLPEIKNLGGFLFRVAHNKSIDFFRAAAKDRHFANLIWEKIELPAQGTADTPLLMQEYESKLREAIELLPPQRKKVFILHQEKGLSHTQIAEQLGISKNTVANTIVEARQFIKGYLTQNLDLIVLMVALSTILKNR